MRIIPSIIGGLALVSICCANTGGLRHGADGREESEQSELGCWFQCPTNSFPATRCPWSIHQCTCVKGYVKRGNRCVRQPPPCFRCPANSVPSTRCPWSFQQCACNRGYIKTSNRCVPYHQRCFKCPRNSRVFVECPRSIHQCLCQAGFIRSGN